MQLVASHCRENMAVVKRVAVGGAGGAGKTTFASELSLHFETPLGSVRRHLVFLSWESVMWVRGIVGLVLSLTGILWILQGTNVVHGSGMSGHSVYTVLGVVVLLIGVALLAWAWRIRGRQTS